MSGIPMLELESVSAGYMGANVIRNVSIQVRAGQVVALLGPNGAGKTTTLRTISGLIPCSGGRILYEGQDVAQMSPQRRARRGIVMVSDHRGIFKGLTVAEHLRLKYPKQDLDSSRAYEYFPALEELKNRRAGLLSGGEQQMLGIARALVRRPRVLMLDEMSLGLAPVMVERLLPVIRQVAEDLDTAVLMVEQHVYLALEVADYAYVLAHGDGVLQGEAQTLSADTELIQRSYLGASQ